MVNYNNGKIYKIEPICDHDEGDIYIGSTTKQYLSQRMDTHRSNYKRWKNNKCNKVQVFELFDKYGVSNCQIVLIETVNVETNDELLAREKHYIKSVKCVNKNIPGQTNKEYRENHKEEKKLYDQEYKNNHKERIKLRDKKYYENNKEEIELKQREYRNNHNEEIKLKRKEYREANLEKIKEKTVCQCGGLYTYSVKSRHLKTIKHQNYLKSQKDV
jgi:tRNA nucleotidyltransferase/poly(A) polymerase